MTSTDISSMKGLQFLRERELAERWKISRRTLQRWRAEGFGPAYIPIGGAIRYRIRDIEAFEEKMRLNANGVRS